MFRNVPPEEALRRLTEGNRLYAADQLPENHHAHAVNRRHTIHQQKPFAIILGCSDSRVPIEIVFGQSLGDLFVVRNAGYVLNDHVLGSIDMAVSTFGSSLLLVLAHSNCGAVTAAVEASLEGARPVSPAMQTIIDDIRPAVEAVRDEADVIEAAISFHVQRTAAQLRATQPIIAPAVARGELMVVAAEYHLSTGLVSILDGAPLSAAP